MCQGGDSQAIPFTKEATTMKMTTIGLDLAKNMFQLHGVDERGRVVLKKQLKHARVLPFFAQLEPCLIGMEACGGAHHWAREFEKFGHTVKLMAPQFVKPYVKTNKNDAADAEAICEAVDRPNMRFVPIKTGEQQAVLALHRARQSLVKARTAQANQMRGLLAEYGIVIPPGIHQIAQYLPAILEDGENDLPGVFRGVAAAPGRTS
jgi:transposase